MSRKSKAPDRGREESLPRVGLAPPEVDGAIPIDSAPVEWWRRDWVLALLLVIVTMFAYLPAWNGTPIWDDDAHLTKPELRSLEGLTRIWVEPGATQQYYPLIHSFFWIENQLWGDWPA